MSWLLVSDKKLSKNRLVWWALAIRLIVLVKHALVYTSLEAHHKRIFVNSDPVETSLIPNQRLLAGGIVEGDIEEMMAVRLGAVFQPHGIIPWSLSL